MDALKQLLDRAKEGHAVRMRNETAYRQAKKGAPSTWRTSV